MDKKCAHDFGGYWARKNDAHNKQHDPICPFCFGYGKSEETNRCFHRNKVMGSEKTPGHCADCGNVYKWHPCGCGNLDSICYIHSPDEYVPFDKEWRACLMRHKKTQIIDIFSNAIKLSREAVSAIKRQAEIYRLETIRWKEAYTPLNEEAKRLKDLLDVHQSRCATDDITYKGVKMKDWEARHVEALKVLKNLMNSLVAEPKICGHEFTCGCAWDKATDFLDSFKVNP